LDAFWLEHLENMDYLRDSVRLRAYGQQDPLIEYKSEGHRMFRHLLETIDVNIANAIFQAKLNPQSQKRVMEPVKQRPVGEKEIGRNDPCPCGSGKKYKKCHGK
jgi:preprotein translocase subunit SecA